MRIRPFEPADTEAVVNIWEASGLTRPWNDPRRDIARKLRVQPELFVVAESPQTESGVVVGTAMAGFDGHRGWIHYLAVLPEFQGQGIGTALLAECELRLSRIGAPKIQLMIRPENDAVVNWYIRHGYGYVPTTVLGKRIVED